jgi:hypothetical protein
MLQRCSHAANLRTLCANFMNTAKITVIAIQLYLVNFIQKGTRFSSTKHQSRSTTGVCSGISDEA